MCIARLLKLRVPNCGRRSIRRKTPVAFASLWLILAGWTPWWVLAEEATAPIQLTLLEVVDADGNAPAAPSDLLYEGHSPHRDPVLAPPYNVDPSLRQHLTLDDFDDVAGTGRIERVAAGTRLTLEMSGLIPHGVYTLWSDFYVAPGLTPDFANSIGLGSFGAPDGSENSFVAASDGTATFTGIQPPGPLSIYGEASSYALDPPVSDFIVFLAYHIDGQTHGPEPAPVGLEQTFVVQGMADFARPIAEPSTVVLLALGLVGLPMANKRWRTQYGQKFVPQGDSSPHSKDKR